MLGVAANGGRIGADPNLPMLITDADRLDDYYAEALPPDAPAPVQPPPP